MLARDRRSLVSIALAMALLIGFAALLFIGYVVRRFPYYQTTALATRQGLPYAERPL